MAEAPNTAIIVARTFESVAVKMHEERGIPKEEIALALLSAGLTQLSEIWPVERVVEQLMGVAGALMETHNIDPNTGEAGPQATRN